MQCVICGYEHLLPRGFAQHLATHSLTSQQYYDQVNGPSKCKTCDEPVLHFLGLTKGYQLYCSRLCVPRSKISKITWEGNDKRKEYHRKLKADGILLPVKSKGRPKGAKNKHPYPRTPAVLQRWLNNPPHFNDIGYLNPMNKGIMRGLFKPKSPSKYKGDATNICFRSSWELKMMRYLDSNPEVIWWASEETIVPYISPIDLRAHRYYPDFVVHKRSPNGDMQTVMIEIKPAFETKKPVRTKNKSRKTILKEGLTFAKNKAKWKAAEKFCADRNWIFQIITEKELFGRTT